MAFLSHFGALSWIKNYFLNIWNITSSKWSPNRFPILGIKLEVKPEIISEIRYLFLVVLPYTFLVVQNFLKAGKYFPFWEMMFHVSQAQYRKRCFRIKKCLNSIWEILSCLNTTFSFGFLVPLFRKWSTVVN